jgi:hypothetical protein
MNGNKNKMQWWVIALCALGVLMIAGAVTYILMTRTSTGSMPSAAAANANASDNIGELNWVKSLNAKYEANDFIIVVLPGSDDSTAKIDAVVKNVLEQIKQDGNAAEVMTLSRTDPELSLTADRLAIQKLPAVLIYSATGQRAILKGDITGEKLLQAYLTLQKACVPGVSGCCPQ